MIFELKINLFKTGNSLYYYRIMKPDLADKYLKMIGKRKLYPPLNGYSAFIQGSEYNIQKYFKKWYDDKVKPDLFVHMKDGYSQVWLPDDDIRFSSKYAFQEHLDNPGKFKYRSDYLDESIKKVDAIYSEYTYKKIKNSDLNDLLPLVEKIRDIIWDVNGSVLCTVYLDKQLCSEILKKNNSPVSDPELDVLWEKGSEPAFESFDKSQMAHFLKLITVGKVWEDIVEECQYFLTDYHSMRSLGEVEKVLRDKFATYIVDSAKAREALKHEIKEVDTIIRNHGEWLKTLSDNERLIADYLQIAMRIRDRRKNFFAKALTVISRIAERMFEESGLDRGLIPYYTVRELLKGAEYLKSVASSLPERKKGFQWLVPYVGEPEALVTDIDSGIEKINTYFKECHSDGKNSDTIKGQSAFKGKVKGKVRIVTNVNSNHGFTDGEILVAGMTRPEYVPLMKKAAGIITDEGGITCHAAIVSRELKIPCVIGTKIATKLLKDGDVVEVDANVGVVKILN